MLEVTCRKQTGLLSLVVSLLWFIVKVPRGEPFISTSFGQVSEGAAYFAISNHADTLLTVGVSSLSGLPGLLVTYYPAPSSKWPIWIQGRFSIWLNRIPSPFCGSRRLTKMVSVFLSWFPQRTNQKRVPQKMHMHLEKEPFAGWFKTKPKGTRCHFDRERE